MSKTMLIVVAIVVIIIIGNILEPKKDYHYEDAPCAQENDCYDEPTTIKVYDK